MGKVCMSCFESYSNDISLLKSFREEDQVYYICPKRGCRGDIVEIDDILIPTIVLLNEKGYYTTSSCSGHLDELNTTAYIMFDESIDKLPSTPPGFKMSAAIHKDGGKNVTISKTIVGRSSIETFQMILTTALHLYAWAISLPYAEEENGIDIFFVNEDFIDEIFNQNNSEGNSKKEENPKIDADKLKKDISSSTVTMNEFLSLLNKSDDQSKNKEENKSEND